MAMQVGMKLIGKRGPLLDDKQLRRELNGVNQKFGKRLKRSFQQTTQTWEHPVTFHQESTAVGDPSVRVFTTDEIYGYVSEGTSVRYAHMTEDFSPKTRPGTLISSRGSGGLAYVNRNAPLPGIEAREFPKLVEDLHLDTYQREIDNVIEQAIRRANT